MSEEKIRAVLQNRVTKRRLAGLWDEGLLSGTAEEAETIEDIKAAAGHKLAKKKLSDRKSN